MAHQRPVHTRAPRPRRDLLTAKLGQDAARPPAGMRSPQRHDPGLDLWGDLVRTRGRSGALVGQPTQTRRGVAPQPRVQRLPGNPVAARHLHHRRAVVQDLQHSPVALLHQPQLHQHGVGLLRLCPPKAHSEEGWNPQINRRLSPTYRSQCRPGPGAASPNCRPAAGTTAESMSRTHTLAGGMGVRPQRGPGWQRAFPACCRQCSDLRRWLVGLPGLEPGTSSLSGSGTFAGYVQAARALGDQVIGDMSVTAVVRWIPGLPV